MSVKQHPDGRWYVRYRRAGKDSKEYFGRGQVARLRAEQFDEQQKAENGRTDPVRTIRDILNDYHNQHPVEASTADTDFYRIDRILIPTFGKMAPEEMKSRNVNLYIQERIESGIAPATIRREITLLKAAFTWACRQVPPLLAFNPLHEFRMPSFRSAPTPAPPTGQEIAAILAEAPEHLTRAIYIAWHLGVRPGDELLGITWEDVDMTGFKVRVLSARKGAPATRYVPFAPEGQLADAMRNWLEEDRLDYPDTWSELPVVHFQGRRIDSIKHTWTTTKHRAGVRRRLRLYDLRHAMATYALEAGADLKATSQVLGHSRPDTTLRHYQHIVNEQQRDAVSRVPRIPGPYLVRKRPNDTKKQR